MPPRSYVNLAPRLYFACGLDHDIIYNKGILYQAWLEAVELL